MSHSEVIVRAEPIVDAFTTGNPIQGPTPSFLVVGDPLRNMYEHFKEVHRGAETGNHTMVAERNSLRPPFNQVFIDIMDFVELAARKDPTLPYRAGCEYFWHKKASPIRTVAVGKNIPTLTVSNLNERGAVLGKVTGVAKARSYEMQYTYGDPTVEANWGHLAVHPTASKMVSRNLEAGKNCSLRVRAVATTGVSPWSNYVTLIIT
ncbi:hypothetical protein [Geomonas subterranea]|uniref:Fibronectin type-III domain-containing protein n=1 Tax=Geomonas subterranea TaxID=2847989 RepID=A0ABX8LKR5_9BACT|nr:MULTISPECIES: hypothetical protein [Geomonas]QXE90924.1 hypothetical protein KP001_21535 [Geomonas subterranea]QXM10990.1 hypothetical protein KP002_07735 [Geomonas subterranea]